MATRGNATSLVIIYWYVSYIHCVVCVLTCYNCDVRKKYRSVQPLLLAYARVSRTSARVLWMSSLDAEPTFDLEDDWQLTKTLHSYQASKFQTELICSELEKRTREAQQNGHASSMQELVAPDGEIHHLITSPGITATNMSSLLNIPIPGWRYLMLTAFFLVRTQPLYDCLYILTEHLQVRLAGSPHILMSLYAAAVATVHLALVPLRAVPTPQNSPDRLPDDVDYPHWHSYYGQKGARVQALRFGSENDRWGHDRPGVIAVPIWDKHPDAGEVLLGRFERLYQVLRTRDGAGGANGRTSNGKA